MQPAAWTASEQRLPVKIRIAVLFKVLTYDKNIQKRCPSGLRVGVVHLADHHEGTAVARETFAHLQAIGNLKVKGLDVSATLMPISGASELAGAMEKKDVNLLYLCPGIESMMPSILTSAAANDTLLITGEADLVRQGAAVGAVLHGQKPKILIHVESAKSQGASFDSRILRLAEMVH